MVELYLIIKKRASCDFLMETMGKRPKKVSEPYIRDTGVDTEEGGGSMGVKPFNKSVCFEKIEIIY